MNIQLIRHATLWIQYAGVSFLVDPMFSEAGANPPVMNSANDRRNPLIPLSGALAQWLSPDAVIVTHLHPDHWDGAAANALPKDAAIYCQPGDRETIASTGFGSVTEIETSVEIGGITLTRTGGQHGTGEIGERMGKVSGFIFQEEGHPTLYIAGDTIWCEEVREALDTFKPDVTVVNAGGARFLVGDAITMDAEDVATVCRYAPYTKVVAIHMDAINHCLVTRDDLRASLRQEGLLAQAMIPMEGETIEYEHEQHPARVE